MLEALKARNEVAALGSRQTNRQFYFAPSALHGLLAHSLGRCPRLLHFAPLALSKQRTTYCAKQLAVQTVPNS
jgi:hypothetical protein